MRLSKRKKILLMLLLFLLATMGLAIYKLSSAVSSEHAVSARCCGGGISGDSPPTCLCGMG